MEANALAYYEIMKARQEKSFMKFV
jgi:hypothetical protein